MLTSIPPRIAEGVISAYCSAIATPNRMARLGIAVRSRTAVAGEDRLHKSGTGSESISLEITQCARTIQDARQYERRTQTSARPRTSLYGLCVRITGILRDTLDRPSAEKGRSTGFQ